MKKYLILAETDELGYFLEIHEHYEFALQREQLFFELAFNPPTDRRKMRKSFKPLGSYPIDPEIAFPFDHLAGTSNGFNATYILEIDDSFSFEKFTLQRNSSRAKK